MPTDRHIIKMDFAMYLIFHPSYPGCIWAEVSKDGETSNEILAQGMRVLKLAEIERSEDSIHLLIREFSAVSVCSVLADKAKPA